MAQQNEGVVEPKTSHEASPTVRKSAEQFYSKNWRLLMKVAMQHGASREEAEDAVHEIMIDMLRRWDKILNHKSYAATAVLNCVIKWHKRDRRQVELARKINSPSAEGGDWDRLMTVWENRQWVEQLLDRLPPAQREAMSLYVEGLTSSEIAEDLDKRPATVRKNLQFARERLRQLQELDRQADSRAIDTAFQARKGDAQ
ncbi:RNA polymerase sigma factor [Nonomuraea sp. KM90]|uniref:RNA polymerase sigma factor n=1 Tax=Nonomuraea sp. KM90 TaxID=3457428 RepID=UPI003FCCFACB